MEGAVAYATNWAQNNPDHLTFIVYSTDGEPTGCGFQNSTSAAANLAATAASGSPPVKTFVIGVGSELTTLNDIATAGGTGQAFLVDTTVDVAQQFIDALNDIRAAGECKFQIPQPGTGVPDYEKVNVSLYDDDDPQDATTISYVSAEANCDPVTGGWYYDSPVDPQMIILCEASCDMVKLSDWSVNVLVGCETIAN